MKNEDIYLAVSDIDESFVEQAQQYKFSSKKRRMRIVTGAAAAVLAVVIGVSAAVLPDFYSPVSQQTTKADGTESSVTYHEGETHKPDNASPIQKNYTLAEPVYPKMMKYPDGYNQDEYIKWRESKRTQIEQMTGSSQALERFCTLTAQTFLSGAQDKNMIYSPINIYMALSVLSEITQGESRQQILNLLGENSIDDLRSSAKSLWNANYCDDGASKSLLSASLWLNNQVEYNQNILNTVAENYYASCLSGSMGSAEYSQALNAWLKEQTGGMLEANYELDADTVLALAATIYFKGRWQNEFTSENNTDGAFRTPNGTKNATYMNASGMEYYYWGKSFAATKRQFDQSGEMLFILPDEGVRVDSLLSDEEVLDFVYNTASYENSKYLKVNFSVPKFDVTSEISLEDGLMSLGVKDVFSAEKADFSPLTKQPEDSTGMYVSRADHKARVLIDEEGCIAAAYTVMSLAGGAMPNEEIDLKLNRPFLFVIKSEAGQVLFMGVVNNP